MVTQRAKSTPAPLAPRTPLSRERVLRAAIALADEGGIESLSMRKLGQELGVEAMSLYNHVANKDDILAAILDSVVSEIEVPSPEVAWKPALRESARSAHEVLLSHAWACRLLNSSTSGVGPARIRWMDSVLGCLRRGGFSVPMTHHAYHALDSHITGFTLWQLSFSFTTEELADVGRTFLRQLPVATYPYLAEHVEHHVAGSEPDDPSEFDFGLDLILDGLERILNASPPSTSTA